MQPTTTNGAATTAQEILQSLRQVIDRLEAELQKQRDEIKQLRAERDDATAMVKALKDLFQDLKEWEDFDPTEYTLTFDDILAGIRSGK
jgi:uncharacterized protein (UPF0335 family)